MALASASAPRVGLALAGGGPLGAIYEIGALCALEEALPALDFTALQGYVGVSAGAIVAATLANGLTPRRLCAAFIENDPASPDVIAPHLFYRPAVAEYLARAVQLPGLAGRALWRVASGRRSLLGAVEQLGRALPAGLFSNAPLRERLASVLSAPGRTDDFRQLKRHLVIVATDLDTGDAAPFGQPGWDDVPISLAATASAALPGLFPPVNIKGRWYVDGALKKTLHASVLLDQGVDLLLCLNPLVPFDASLAATHRVGRPGRGRRRPIPALVEGGLPVVLSQTFRSLIHSRLEMGLRGYQRSHPNADVLLFEPDQRDSELFSANLFSTSQRRALAEHAYQATRADLRSRRGTLNRSLARHGLALDDAALDDPQARLLPPGRGDMPDAALALPLQRLQEVLDDLDAALARLGTQPAR
ncbi:putative esterase of the alpha-beta hydrolase superfamily [Burkholderiales bacterium JOSHI_001]|nr:putative esterase of the alpha-beta hydrolase superfamily [Burkholderiales bacterium JOSHI_001]